MAGGRRGLVAPQNTFLENIVRRSNGKRCIWISVSQVFCFNGRLYHRRLPLLRASRRSRTPELCTEPRRGRLRLPPGGRGRWAGRGADPRAPIPRAENLGDTFWALLVPCLHLQESVTVDKQSTGQSDWKLAAAGAAAHQDCLPLREGSGALELLPEAPPFSPGEPAVKRSNSSSGPLRVGGCSGLHLTSLQLKSPRCRDMGTWDVLSGSPDSVLLPTHPFRGERS